MTLGEGISVEHIQQPMCLCGPPDYFFHRREKCEGPINQPRNDESLENRRFSVVYPLHQYMKKKKKSLEFCGQKWLEVNR